mgnify:CR=1 FL=1
MLNQFNIGAFRFYFNNNEAVSTGLSLVELYHRKYDKQRQVHLMEPVHDKSSHAADALRMLGIADESAHDPFLAKRKVKVLSDYDLFGDYNDIQRNQ